MRRPIPVLRPKLSEKERPVRTTCHMCITWAHISIGSMMGNARTKREITGGGLNSNLLRSTIEAADLYRAADQGCRSSPGGMPVFRPFTQSCDLNAYKKYRQSNNNVGNARQSPLHRGGRSAHAKRWAVRRLQDTHASFGTRNPPVS